MSKFEFYNVGRIVFGRGQAARIGELAKQFGAAALLVYNTTEPGAGGETDRVADALRKAGMRVVFLRQRGEPWVGVVDAAVETARRGGCDVVIGLGGGSAIDTAKATAGLLSNGGSALDYMEVVGKGQKITRPAAPWIAMPTTAGTGAEATRNAVVGYPEKQFKASIRSEYLLARVAVVDAELGVNVPPEVTASSGMDALCQLIESYTSNNANAMSDALAIQGIPLAARALRRVYADGRDLDAREDMAMAALLSGITLANAGLGAVHGFASPLGASFPVPHGAACAALLPHVIAANIQAMRAESARHVGLARYAVIGRALAGQSDLENDAAIEMCAQFTASLARDLKIPALGQFGLGVGDIPGMVALARKSSSMRYNPVTLSETTLSDILRKAIGA
ncbi:MAG TPA: iron-containing alcohol dehydrogenase [Tepidisphaeraceae bacterium]|nr:iron-containing alcohol dehydrogenase [Tepidisphaeraceae bacterium]